MFECCVYSWQMVKWSCKCKLFFVKLEKVRRSSVRQSLPKYFVFRIHSNRKKFKLKYLLNDHPAGKTF